jgi:hypothetical protein
MKRLREFGEIDPDDIFHAFRTYPEHMRDWICDLKEGESAFDNVDDAKNPIKSLMVNWLSISKKTATNIVDRFGTKLVLVFTQETTNWQVKILCIPKMIEYLAFVS